jgi:hypothetical protein
MKKETDNTTEYNNIPPKDIMNAIWGRCFDYKDFDDKILDKKIRDRIYDTWQIIHLCMYDWINENQDGFINYIKENKPDLNFKNEL